MTRSEAIAIARRAAGGKHQPSYCTTPASSEPHEWVLDAIEVAYERGRSDEHDRVLGALV